MLDARWNGTLRTITTSTYSRSGFHACQAVMISAGLRQHPCERPAPPDPVLGCPADRINMIVGEVKEGAARFHPAIREPLVLELGLARFGCCDPADVPEPVRRLLASGKVAVPAGHRIRLLAFGAAGDVPGGGRRTTTLMAHSVGFLRSNLRGHREVLRNVQLRDSGLAMLALREKWNADGESR